MTDADKVRKILVKHFPEECDAVGPSNLLDLIEEQTDFNRPTTGRQFPLLEVLQVLAAAVSFIKGVFDIWEALTRNQGRAPTKQELRSAIDEDQSLKGALEKTKRDEIIDSIAK